MFFNIYFLFAVLSATLIYCNYQGVDVTLIFMDAINQVNLDYVFVILVLVFVWSTLGLISKIYSFLFGHNRSNNPHCKIVKWG
jgi:hypothetical protein